MTCDNARLSLQVWAQGATINCLINMQIADIRRCAEAARNTSARASMTVSGVHASRYGDSVGYAVGLADRLERRIKHRRALAVHIDRIVERTDRCVPDDPAIRRALRARERFGATWRGIGAMYKVSPAQAREAWCATLRRLIKCPWTQRDEEAARIALGFIR